MSDLSPAIIAAILGNAAIASQLADFNGSKSIHSRRPVPDGAGYKMIVVSPDISHTDTDAINAFRSVIVKDISIFGHQPDDYRDVEKIGYAIRRMFHRNRRSIAPDDCHVVSVTATGPFPAPSDDDKIVGRAVSVTFVVQPK